MNEDKYIPRAVMQVQLKNLDAKVDKKKFLEGLVSQGYTIEGLNDARQTTPAQGGFMERVAGKVGGRVKDITEAVSGAWETTRDQRVSPAMRTLSTIPEVGKLPLRVAGAVAGAGADIIGEGVNSLSGNETVKTLEQARQEDAIYQALIKSLGEEGARTAADVFNTLGGAAIGKGVKIVAPVVAKGAKAVVGAVKDTTGKIIEPAADIGGSIKQVAKEGIETLKQVPARIKTNVAERQAVEQDINSLASPTAQRAAREGVDIADTKQILNIRSTPQTQKLVETVKQFADGNTKTDPIEVVGEPIVARFKDLNKQKAIIGRELGEASKNIGILTKPDLEGGVISRLKQVPGLEDLSVVEGRLNFKGTTLDNNLQSSIKSRKAIENVFKEATKWGDGEKAHRFRQTLFEELGGKKKSLANITDTEERAYNAIRSGLSDVIESKNAGYKKLSKEYRSIVEPTQELQKRLKLSPNDPEIDLADANLSAGILARRITSAASSNAEVRALLRSLDKAGRAKSNLFEESEQLQDLYNLLNKYYDIAPKTGYQALTQEATAKGVLDAITKNTIAVAGRTDVTRRKALEELLDEILKTSSGVK